jgi:restriction system protein
MNRQHSERTPEEELADAHRYIHNTLAMELLSKVKALTPEQFERLGVALLEKMGYGTGEVLGRSGDGGIDGVIMLDPLGLDVICLQTKRWAATIKVGRPEIQQFAGALQGRRESKGVFITASCFTKHAEDYVKTIAIKIILIDGKKLSELMIKHGLGVARVAVYEVKRIDADYFTGEALAPARYTEMPKRGRFGNAGKSSGKSM